MEAPWVGWFCVVDGDFMKGVLDYGVRKRYCIVLMV